MEHKTLISFIANGNGKRGEPFKKGQEGYIDGYVTIANTVYAIIIIEKVIGQREIGFFRKRMVDETKEVLVIAALYEFEVSTYSK